MCGRGVSTRALKILAGCADFWRGWERKARISVVERLLGGKGMQEAWLDHGRNRDRGREWEERVGKCV